MADRPTKIDADTALNDDPPTASPHFNGTAKPYTRWWWLAGPFRHEDITQQLVWARDNGFGGVELAWLWPVWLDKRTPGIAWLGKEWSSLITYAKSEADRLGLGCDFTLGSCWPFGGSMIGPNDASQTFEGASEQRLRGSWEDPYGHNLLVLNHLDRHALRKYAGALIPAFAGGLKGKTSALFCDSLELHTDGLWSTGLYDRFAERFGYRLEGQEDDLEHDPDLRYDYRTLIAETILEEFYHEFATICRENQTVSRVQCHGAPTDLLSAYASVDIPESEAILFNPTFSRIAASAAALSKKHVVSAETFTCLYGFISRRNLSPLMYWKKDQIADVKLLADALFAQGVNQIVWHGMPFNPPADSIEFYASVHVGPDAAFAADLPAFNAYLETISSLLRIGRVESRLAIYLPNEDNRMLDEIPTAERTPGARYRWEMRHVTIPRELEGFAPLWISYEFLRRATVSHGRLQIGDCLFSALLVDVAWLDGDALAELVRIAAAGLPLILLQVPQAPGKRPRPDYDSMIAVLLSLPTVVRSIGQAEIRPIVSGVDMPPFWTRRSADALYLLFAHPKTREVVYPMRYGQSLTHNTVVREVTIDFDGEFSSIDLEFAPYQSIMVRVTKKHTVSIVDCGYLPPVPVQLN